MTINWEIQMGGLIYEKLITFLNGATNGFLKLPNILTGKYAQKYKTSLNMWGLEIDIPRMLFLLHEGK